MDVSVAQHEIRRAYLRGGPRAVVSGLVWLISGFIARANGIHIGFAALFLSGMLLFPISRVLARGLFRRENASPGNPGGLTAVETIFPLIGGFLAAWLIIPYRPDEAFPLAAIAVGGHYFRFRTADGDWGNWLLSAAMCAVGTGTILFGFPGPSWVPSTIAFLEMAAGISFIRISLSQEAKPPSSECPKPIPAPKTPLVVLARCRLQVAKLIHRSCRLLCR